MGKLDVYNGMVRRYSDVADFVTVYVAEAHPLDGWALLNHNKYSRHQHKDLQERISAALVLQEAGLDGSLLVDSMCNQGPEVFAALPERMYVILDGVVTYKGGLGPFGYQPEQVARWLKRWQESMTINA